MLWLPRCAVANEKYPTTIYLKKSSALTNVTLCDLLSPADDGGPAGSGHAKVVSLPQASDDRDAALHQEMLGKI